MADRGGQPGNTNATKNRPITEALRRVLLANNGEKMRQMTEAIVNRAIVESDAAAREVMDRIEGRPAQTVTLAGDPDNPLNIVERRVVKKNGT